MQKLLDLFKAVRAGEELSNPAGWKNVQATTIAVAVLLDLLRRYLLPELELPQELVDEVVGIIVKALGAISFYLVYATSKKVGPGGKE